MVCTTDDELAALDAGALDGDAALAVQAHLERCEECSRRRRRVLDLAGALASVAASASPEATRASWERLARKLAGVRETARAVAVNCCFCKDAASDAERVHCSRCLAVHHDECWREHEKCAACGHGVLVRAERGGARAAPVISVTERAPVPAAFGEWLIVSELGRGGMGVVYKARHRTSGQLVALKVFLAAGRAATRLQRGVVVGRRLAHPNIAGVIDSGVVDGLTWVAMELVEGDVLADRLVRGPRLERRRALEIVRDVARGAHFAHLQGVVHRDLKPENVIVDREGRARILDFGAGAARDEGANMTRDGVVIGTPFYMSPEQARGEHRSVDARSDVWAIGATLYYALTGVRPFDGATSIELFRKIIDGQPVAPSRHDGSIARELDAIVLKALAKRKEDRYATAEDLAADIERFLAGQPVLATIARPGLLRRVARWLGLS